MAASCIFRKALPLYGSALYALRQSILGTSAESKNNLESYNSRGSKDEKVYRKADGVLKLFDKSGKLIQEIEM